MNSEVKDLVKWAVLDVIAISGLLLMLFAMTATQRNSGYSEINEYTQDNTRYIVKDKLVFNNNLVSYFNPFGGKDHYKVEVQKYKADNHGVKRWQYDKTIDYGTHEPDINK